MFKMMDTISPLLGHLMPIAMSFADGDGGGDGGDGGNWYESLPPDMKSDPLFQKYKDANEAHRALLAAQKFLGRETLPVPRDANDKEAINLILKKLGLPDKEDGYVLPTDLNIPAELPIDEAMLADFKKTALGAGILPSQFDVIYRWYMNNMVGTFHKMAETNIEATKDTWANLRKKWGAATQQNIMLAKKVFQTYADDKTFMEFDKGYGNNPVLIELFANIGKILSEDQLSGQPKGLTMTPDEAQIEIDKIKADRKHPYWIKEDAGHDAAVQRFNDLIKLTESGE